jgi:hypothetical protein
MSTNELSPVIAAETGKDYLFLPPHVSEFMGAVERSKQADIPVFVLPSFAEGSEHAHIPRMAQTGVYLDAPVFAVLSGEGQRSPQFDFDLQRARGFNAQRSAHQVFFGDISYLDPSDGQLATQPVAVKRFDKGHHKALHEYVHLKALGAQGFTVFSPAGILITEHAEYLVTQYEDTVSTMDNENWAYMLSGESERNLMEDRMEDMASALAELHVKARTFHCDAKTRNIVRTIDGKTNFIDFESAETMPDTPSWLAAFKNKAGADIMSLYKSLEENRGLFAVKKGKGVNGEERHAIFRELFMNHYVLAVSGYAASLPVAERRQLADALYGLQDDIYFKVFEDWDKRKIPHAKRDPLSLEPHVVLELEGDVIEDSESPTPSLRLVHSEASDSAYAKRVKKKVIRNKRNVDSSAKEADAQTAMWLGRITKRTLSHHE